MEEIVSICREHISDTRCVTLRVEIHQLKVEDHPPGNHCRWCVLREKLWAFSHNDQGWAKFVRGSAYIRQSQQRWTCFWVHQISPYNLFV